MRDPYLYDDVDVLRNLGNIRDAEELRRAEGDVTKHTMSMVYAHRFNKYNTETLCEIHRIIFDNLFDWAGEFRTIPVIKHEEVLGGDTVRYAHPNQIKKELYEASKEISKLKKSEPKQDTLFKLVRIAAKIWQTHPFREGNTRTVISFVVLLAAHLRIEFDYSLFEKHAAYVRNALVWASQGMYSKYEYLERIFYDAAGVAVDGSNPDATIPKDYTQIEGYYVADYKEQPHMYLDEDEK
ncbi:MAG: Fic family protein [Oscillospiraceae bacterium]|nr:Fic family protein [Oscillospiraceae bacterium]